MIVIKKFVFLLILIIGIGAMKYTYAVSFESPLTDYVVTSEFGERLHPVTFEPSFHYGIDLAAPQGTEVYAAMDGEVVVRDTSEGYGNYIVLENGIYRTTYAHLDGFNCIVGDIVSLGDCIGYVGSTGRSTGPHLHFEIIENGEYKNPRDFINFGSASTPPLEVPVNLYVVSHDTGMIRLALEGALPLKVYKSFDNNNYTLMQVLETNMYNEYGLSNGQTVWYKVEDYYGNTAIARYTPPYTNMQILPLQIVQLNDTTVHLKWSHVHPEVDLYLDGALIAEDLDSSEYTISGLDAGTQHTVYFINKLNERSNTITFKTTKKLDAIEKILTKLFFTDFETDSNSNSIPDIMEPLKQKLDELLDRLGGGMMEDAQDILEGVDTSDFPEPEGLEDLATLPKIEVEYGGMLLKILDLENEFFLEIIQTLRAILVAIVTVSFVFLVISLFNINFKV